MIKSTDAQGDISSADIRSSPAATLRGIVEQDYFYLEGLEDKGSRTTHTWHHPITVTPMMTILGQREALDVREMVAMTPKDASSMHLSENKGIRVRHDSVNQLVKSYNFLLRATLRGDIVTI